MIKMDTANEEYQDAVYIRVSSNCCLNYVNGGRYVLTYQHVCGVHYVLYCVTFSDHLPSLLRFCTRHLH